MRGGPLGPSAMTLAPEARTSTRARISTQLLARTLRGSGSRSAWAETTIAATLSWSPVFWDEIPQRSCPPREGRWQTTD